MKMFKSFISADRLQRAAILLRDQEKQEQTSSLYELRNAFSPDALENSRIRTWNKVRAGLDAASLSAGPGRTRTVHSRGKRLLAALAAMILLFGMTLAVSAGAREKALDLYRTIRGNQTRYVFHGKDNGSTQYIPCLEADKYFEGFEQKVLVDLPKNRDEYYKNDITNDEIMYSCAAIDTPFGIGVRENAQTRESTSIHGYDADLYRANENVSTNTLVWVDTQQGLIFMISTTLSIEELFDIAELIYQ